jgi:hypothetical protein
MIRKGMIGAKVGFCGHQGYFLADIMQVANAWVVRANGPVSPDNIIRQDVDEEATHWVMDTYGGFWRPDLGVFVVPNNGLKLTRVGNDRISNMWAVNGGERKSSTKLKKAA